jgi:enoyl-CoA hydratase
MEHQYQTLQVEISARVVRIIFNRPEKLNAINSEMVTELHQALEQLEKNHSQSVLIFEGAGNKSFIAGADIAALKSRTAQDALQGINANLFQRIADFPFVTIAKIQGFCLGGGLELAMACDMRFASLDSKFGQPEVGLGIIPAAGATFRLPALIGPGRAKEMIFSGLRINADRAAEIGLINQSVAADTLTKLVNTTVERILKQSPGAVQAAKQLMQNSMAPQFNQAASEAQAILFDSSDKHQRMEAFLNKSNS